MIIKFFLPLPPSLNVALRSHWSSRKRWQDEMDELVYFEIRRHFKEPIPDWGKVKVKYTVYSNWMMDAENRVMVIKYGNDAIVKSGLIKDDSPRYISYELPKFKWSGERKVEVEIRRVREGMKNRGEKGGLDKKKRMW